MANKEDQKENDLPELSDPQKKLASTFLEHPTVLKNLLEDTNLVNKFEDIMSNSAALGWGLENQF